MAAKLLHSLADDNPDLQKQIGCMNGLLQIFDRHHMGRRLNGHSTHKAFSPSGNSQLANISLDADSSNAFNQGTMVNTKAPIKDPVVTQPSVASPKLGRLSLDLRDIVKDSMHRESRHKDSPRPLQLSKSFNERRNDLPSDLKESLKLLARLQDIPRYSYDGREISHVSDSSQRIEDLPRLSLDSKESSMRRASGYDLNLAYLSKDAENGDDWLTERAQKVSRPSSVVAKLMGLEPLPDNKPRKPISSSKCAIETAPWKHLEGSGSPQKKAIKQLKTQGRVSNSPYVYREVEKKLKELEFEQCGNDLRDLKHILDAMEAKGLLGKEKEGKSCKGSSRNYGYISTSESHRMSKIQTSKDGYREIGGSSSTKRVSSNANLRVGPKKAQPVSGSLSSSKNSSSTSPRLQKKLEFEKRDIRQSLDLGKSRRQSTESCGYPGRRRRVKSNQSQILPSEIRTSPRNVVSEGERVEEVPAIGPEHPSPVSVLDVSSYGEDSLSPVKKTLRNLEGIEAKTSEGDHLESESELADNFSTNHDIEPGFTSVIKNNTSTETNNLLEKLPLPVPLQNSNPVHTYVSKILSASGLLLSNPTPAFATLQTINPELFLVLEQTSSDTKLERVSRKLIFDTVTELLGLKLAKKAWINAETLLRDLCKEIEGLQGSERRETGLVREEWKRVLWEDLMGRSDGWVGFCRDEAGVVLDVERLIFKDLVDEIVIGEVDGLGGKGRRRSRRVLFN